MPNFDSTQSVEEDCQPPSPEVMKQALSELVKSIQEANNMRNQKMGQTPDDSDPNEDGRLPELVKVACQALVLEADIQSSELRRRHEARVIEFRRQNSPRETPSAAIHNALAPINNLPVELFSNILLIASLDGWGRKSHHDVCGILGSVGKHWFEVVISTPQFWSTLDERMPLKHLQLAIERSKSAPLHVRFDGPAFYPSQLLKRNSFTEWVLPHAHRWRAIEGVKVPRCILECLEEDTPGLQSIVVRPSWSNFGLPTERLELGNGARVQSLRLHNVAVPWTSARLQDLRSLSLSALKSGYAPSLGELARILTLSPNLVDLELDGVEVDSDDGDDPEASDLGFLPDLRLLKRLQLAKIPRVAYDYLLDQIPLHTCSNVELQPNPLPHTSSYAIRYRHDSPKFADQVKHLLGCDKPIQLTLRKPEIPSNGRVGIELSIYKEGSDLSSRSDHSDTGFCLDLPVTGMVENYMEVVAEMTEFIQQTCETAPLHLKIEAFPHFPLQCLSRFTTVTQLELWETGNVEAIIRLLAQPQGAASTYGRGAWLYPGLTSLYLAQSYSHYSAASIREWVKDRWVKCEGYGGIRKRPEGSVEVKMPMTNGGRTELWKPVGMDGR
ncbi:hypothetical protein FRB96_007703 [Tulasnella sp. 330]|nr:hypothetical protein FRB96_007703 [Tulasnella sp. 330]